MADAEKALFGEQWQQGAAALNPRAPPPPPGPAHAALDRASLRDATRRRDHGVDHHFSCMLDRWEVANQRQTGRCWIYAAMNVLKTSAVKNFKSFQLSPNYLAFYDKLEKANTFLQLVRQTAELPIDARIVQHLLATTAEDGGQWNMVVGLVEKYGVVPQWCMQRCQSEDGTRELNGVLERLLRQAAHEVRSALARQQPAEAAIRSALGKVRTVLVTHYGPPPERFRMRWRDDDQEEHDMGELTPLGFSEKLWRRPPAEYVVLVHDPRPRSPLYQRYIVNGLTSCVEKSSFAYINVPIEDMKACVAQSLQELKEPVWFACDVGQEHDSKRGLLVHQLYNTWSAYGFTQPSLDKAQRLEYGGSLPTHAMTFTGLDEQNGKIVKWRVENSWGDEGGDDNKSEGKGFLAMDDSWFDEYVYEVAVPRSLVPAETLSRAEQRETTALPLWDPMGSVAR